jgi:hypothetical protein
MASFDDFLKMFKDSQGIDQPAVTIPYRPDESAVMPPLGLAIGGQQEIVGMPSGSTPDESMPAEMPAAPPQITPDVINKLKAMSASRAPTAVPQAMPIPAKPPVDLEDKQYLGAQDEARKNRKYAELLAASNQMAQGVASLGAGKKVDVNNAGAEMLMKSADAPVKDLTEQRKQEKEFLDLMDDKKKNDPTSEVSQLYRKAFKDLGVQLGDGATASELEKASPVIAQAINTQLNREAQKLRYAELADNKAERNNDKKRELDDKYMSKFNDTINKFEKEKVEGDKYFDTALTLADDATKSPTAAVNLARSLIKSIEGAGARVSDKDIETTLRAGGVSDNAIAQLQTAESGTIPPFQAEDVKKLMRAMKAISDTKFNERKEQMVYRQAQLLKTTPERIKEATFMPEAKKESTESNTVRVISPAGKTGTIPRSNLEAAKKQGFKEI